MLRVRVLKKTVAAKKVVSAGEVMALPEAEARYLIGIKKAEIVSDEEPAAIIEVVSEPETIEEPAAIEAASEPAPIEDPKPKKKARGEQK